jgi:hypothetical protein
MGSIQHKQHVDSAPRNGQLLPPQPQTPFPSSLDSRFSAAMKLFRLLPAKWGRGLPVVGGEISLKAMVEAQRELLKREEPVLHRC